MIRFIHTADWQIGRLDSRFEAGDASLLAAERVEGVRRIAGLARAHAVDAVLVAGDVFDSQTPRDKTLLRLFEAMEGFEGPWLLLPGNHDAALPESVWQRALRLNVVPPQVRLCLRPEVVLVDGRAGGRFAVLPAPLTQRHTHEDLTRWFDAAGTPEGLPRIGLAHGSVAGVLADDVDSPNPIAADRAERARLDYLALGDWHGCKCIDARTWYSGTHEPERFRDNEPGHALRVEIDAPGEVPRVTRLATARYAWRQFVLTVRDAADAEQALATLAGIDADTVVDLRLSGHADLPTLERLRAAVQQAERRAAAMSAPMDALALAPTEADLEGLRADGFVGEALAELKSQLAGPQAELARDALLHLVRLSQDLHGSEGAGA